MKGRTFARIGLRIPGVTGGVSGAGRGLRRAAAMPQGAEREVRMKRMLLALVLAGSFALTGCETNQDTGTLVGAVAGGVIGNQFGKGGGRAARTMAGAGSGGTAGKEVGGAAAPGAGAVLGGVAGNEMGGKVDARGRELARQAEFDAWERGQAGRPY